MHRALVIPLVLLSALSAQRTSTTAYVQSALGGAYGNSVPFGCSASGLFAEARSQLLILPQFLPGPNAVLTGIALHGRTASGGSGSLVYPLLRITVSRSPATGLGATFASNLPAPVVVLDARNVSIHWVADAWTVIPFGVSYVHDGSSGLVIDIQKVVTPTLDLGTRTIQNAGRADLPRMINALGGAGSGAYAASAATVTTNFPPSMLLRWVGSGPREVPTLKLRSDAASAFGNQFAIRGSMDHTVEGPPGSAVVHLAAPGFHLRSSPVPWLDGSVWLEGAFTLGQATVPPSGETTMTIPIPNSPSLVGLHLALQSVVVESLAPPWRVTNAVDCIIQG